LRAILSITTQPDINGSVLGAKGEWLWMRACTRAFATGDKYLQPLVFFSHRRKTSTAIGLTAADHRSSRFYPDDARTKKRKTMAMPLPCVGLRLERSGLEWGRA
jgi:hypothetical protein